MKSHDHYMNLAIELARNNLQAPFGTLLVDMELDDVVANGLNQSQSNPLLHGETDAINNYAALNLNRWSSLRLYTTAEPCCMCMAAIIWSKIPEVVFGTSIASLKEFGWRQFDLDAQQVLESASFANCEIIGGVLADRCDELFQKSANQEALE